MNKKKYKLGIGAGVLSAIFAILWFIAFSMRDNIHAMPNWENLEIYADSFSMLRFLYIYPSLLLPLSYLILLVCLHLTVDEKHKLWSLIALVIGIIYAVMASINYNIQAVAVRLSLAAGETRGIEMFIPDNPNSIFNALANSYIYISISMVFAGFIFSSGKLEKWIKWLLLAQIITAFGQIGYSMFGLSEIVFIATSMIWVIGAPMAFILIAIWYKEKLRRFSGMKKSVGKNKLSMPIIIF